MPFLEMMRRHALPDVDLVVAAVDEPRVSHQARRNRPACNRPVWPRPPRVAATAA